MLEVTSTDIVFEMRNDQYIPFTLGLKNTTNQFLAFKIKSTKPEYFSVRQSRGIINPQQKENVEFSTTDRTKNLDPKYLVNQKFQIYVIGMNERKSVKNYINKRLLKQTCSFNQNNARIQDCVHVFNEKSKEKKQQFIMIVQPLAIPHLLYYYQLTYKSKSRIEQQPAMYSIIKSQTSTNQVEYISKLRQIEHQIKKKEKENNCLTQLKFQNRKKVFNVFYYRFIINEIRYSNSFGSDIIKYLFSSSSEFEMKNLIKQYIFYFQCLLIQSISHYFQQCINLNHFRCGITIVRDRELVDNELEYYKQMNYGLWTILIPFMQVLFQIRFLLLPIFPKKQNQTNLPEDEVSNQVITSEIPNLQTTDNSNLHQIESENQEQQITEDKKEENIITNQLKSNRISILNCAEQNEPQDKFCSAEKMDQSANQKNQSNLDSSHENKINFQLNLNTSDNELNANNISDISHQNQRSFTEETERESSNLIQNSKIIHSYSNSYQIRDQSIDQVDENAFSLIRILEIIDEVPILVIRKYEEFVRINRESRRKFIYINHKDFTDDDAQQYIKLLKNLFRFHDNLIRKGQKYYIYKQKLDYTKFMKCFKQYLMDPLSSNEILSHQRFALKQIRYSLQNNHTLLHYQVLEVYETLIQLMSNPNEILLKISQQFHQQQEQLYLSSILQFYLEDYVFQQKGIEDEDFQRYLNIYHNQNEIINMQYTLDEKTNHFLYNLQRN